MGFNFRSCNNVMMIYVYDFFLFLHNYIKGTCLECFINYCQFTFMWNKCFFGGRGLFILYILSQAPPLCLFTHIPLFNVTVLLEIKRCMRPPAPPTPHTNTPTHQLHPPKKENIILWKIVNTTACIHTLYTAPTPQSNATAREWVRELLCRELFLGQVNKHCQSRRRLL